MSTPLFAPLPLDFDQLALAVRHPRDTALRPEPDLRSVGERTYSAFAEVDFAPLHPHAAFPPRARDWRNLPYALWLGAERGLHHHPALTHYFFDVAVPEALNTRRPLKWGRALLHTYLQHFRPDDALFQQLAQCAHGFFAHARVLHALSDTEAHGLTRLLDTLQLLDPQVGPRAVAQDILDLPDEVRLVQWQARHGLTDGFWLNGFARAAFEHALHAPEHVRASAAYVRRLCEWALHAPGTAAQRFRYPLLRDAFAHSVLSPWFERTPDPGLQHTLLNEMLRTLGDPRHDHAGWLGVRQEAIRTASRWLSGRTLDTFFDILRHTEDDIGPYRRRFWEAFFHAGHITDAWVALGEDAVATLHAVDPTGEFDYARIVGKIAPQQCVLMLRMGHLLFCDWSHSGRLRAISASSKQAPKLYQPQYELFELRFPTPLDFNHGQLDDPGLLHLHSAQGGWQTQALDFMTQHLGITMRLEDVMPPNIASTPRSPHPSGETPHE